MVRFAFVRFSSILFVALVAAKPLLAQAADSTYGRGRNDPIVAIVNQVPSFAGMWLDKEGNFHGSLADLNDSARLRPLLADFMADSKRAFLLKPGKRIIVDHARYSYAQLYAWQCLIQGMSGRIAGFQSIGPREDTNQLHIGVTADAGVEQARKILIALKIPLDAVKIDKEGKLFD